MIIQPFACFVTPWNLQAFFAPQAFDLLAIDFPALDTQERGDLTISISAILLGKSNDGESQGILIIILSLGSIPLRTAGLIQYLTGTALTAAKALAYVDHRIPYLFRA